MHLSLVFALCSLASAHLHYHHYHRRRALSSTFSIPSFSIPSLTLPSPPSPFSLQSSPPPPSSPPLSSASPLTSSPSPTQSAPSASASAPSSTPSTTTTAPATTTATTTPATTQQQTDPAFAPTTTLDATLSLPSDPPSSVVVFPFSSTVTPSSTATNVASTSFFSNTGAVAGTFTFVGLVGVAGVIAVALLIVRRHHSRSYDEDMEYLDKSPNRSSDPPLNQLSSPDDGFTSDHGHYTTPPTVLVTPPAAYYPDHAYALQPQLFSPDAQRSRGYPTQNYAVQHVYSPDDYDVAYTPSPPRVDPGMPNPHKLADVQLGSAPVPLSRAALPDALRPSVKPTSTIPKQWENTRFSVDSFYAGIVVDNHSPPGRAL